MIDNPSEIVAIVVARMVPAKNCLFILKLLAKMPSIDRLIWFGDGPQKKIIEEEMQRLDVSSRIRLLGCRPRKEVFQALNNASLYISASKWEGIGVANLEAAALGCWPFLSRIPAHEEIADLLGIPTYPLDDPDKWVTGINNYLSLSMFERDSMRSAISERTRINFDLKMSVNKYINIYRQLATRY